MQPRCRPKPLTNPLTWAQFSRCGAIRCPLFSFWRDNPKKDGNAITPRAGKVSHITVKNKQGANKEPWLRVASLSLPSFSAKQIMKLSSSTDANRGRFLRQQKLSLWLRPGPCQAAPGTHVLLIATRAAFLLWCVGVAGKNQPIAQQGRVNASSKRDP